MNDDDRERAPTTKTGPRKQQRRVDRDDNESDNGKYNDDDEGDDGGHDEEN